MIAGAWIITSRLSCAPFGVSYTNLAIKSAIEMQLFGIHSEWGRTSPGEFKPMPRKWVAWGLKWGHKLRGGVNKTWGKNDNF